MRRLKNKITIAIIMKTYFELSLFAAATDSLSTCSPHSSQKPIFPAQLI